VHGFWWSHIGWITSRRNFPTDYSQVRDLARYPELVFLNRFDAVVPALFAAAVWGLGGFLGAHAPGLHTSGAQLLVWGFFISTTALFHGTSCINSLAHLLGRRRFETEDDSRNSAILAVVTLGEGWHNNHHRYQSATRNGFYWWEIDPTYYGLKALSWTGLIHGLKPVPKAVLAEGAHADHHSSVAAARRAALVHPEYAALRKVVPAAAAIAVATVNAAGLSHGRQAEDPASHRAVGTQAENLPN
jgi:stearoyl-CoA desaturase (delta-9 desaturase)